jgi:site-specific DNA-cytosine methylase
MTDSTKLRAIEICCCAGGMALGFRRAGIEFAFAFDKDADACNSYEHNLGHRPVRLDVHDLLRLVEGGWRPAEGEVDLVVADPPCAPYSSAGKKKGIDDPRDCLRCVVEVVRILKPRAFLLGNVPGLEHENHDAARRDTIGSLCYEGYCIDEAVFDAASFGVPQRRIRPFWYAHLGAHCLSWPTATHGPPKRQLEIGGTELLPWVTCRDALSDLPKRELGKIRNVRVSKGNWHKPSDPDEPISVLTTTTPGMIDAGDDALRVGMSFPPSHEDEPARTVTTRESGGGNRMLLADPKHPHSRPDEPAYTITARDRGGTGGGMLLEWPWDRPATTVCAENWITQPGHCHVGVKGEARQKIKSYQGWRAIVLSERARARLQGFPDTVCGCNGGYPLDEVEALARASENDDSHHVGQYCQDCWLPVRRWVFHGKTKGSRNAQIGMAMPAPLAEAIARSIAEWFARVQADDVLEVAEVVCG